MDCFDSIFYGIFYCKLYECFSLSDTNVLIGLMISLFIAVPALRVRRTINVMGTAVQNGRRFFLLLGKKVLLYSKVKFSY